MLTYIFVCMCMYLCLLLCIHVCNMSIPHMMKYKSFIVSATIKFCWVSHKLVRTVMELVTNIDDCWSQ